MKRLIFFFLLLSACSVTTLTAQKYDSSESQRRTFPVDSCLYFMDPFAMRINQLQTLGGGNMGIRVSFRSSLENNVEFQIEGRGRIIIPDVLLPPDLNLAVNDQLMAFLSLPDDIHDPNGPWAGDNIPLSVILDGFLISAAGQALESPPAIALQSNQFEVIFFMD